MSMETTESKVRRDDNVRSSQRKSTRLEKILSLKEIVDQDVDRLEKEVQSLSSYLTTYARAKGNVLSAQHSRRLKTRKMVTISLAISASSLTLAFHCNHVAGMKYLVPWVTGLGAASLTYSIFYLRDFFLSFKDPCAKWRAIEADVSYVPKRIELNEETIKEITASMDKSISEWIAEKLDREELEIPQRKQLASKSL